MVSSHDGIIDGIVTGAESKVGKQEALPFDMVVSVIASFHREQWQQAIDNENARKEHDEEVLKALQDINATLKSQRNGNSNGHKRKRDRAKAAALPFIGGSSGIGLLIYAKDLLALIGI